MGPDRIQLALTRTRAQLEEAEAKVKSLQERRVQLWQAGRERDPIGYKLTIPQLMAASGVSESLIHKELTKARERDED